MKSVQQPQQPNSTEPTPGGPPPGFTKALRRDLRAARQSLSESLDTLGVDWRNLLRRLRRAVAEELEEPRGLPRNPGDAVNVMTIHRAKGLDFRFVWLPQLHKLAGRNRRNGTFWKDDPGEHPEYALLGLRTLGMDLVELAAERTARAERIRLLYVAMTRARISLWVAVGERAWTQLAAPVAPGGSS